jgi:competence protein CoiA
MLDAINTNGRKVSARRGVIGFCPTCNEKLIPKCGRIMKHHWAHPGKDCDPWHEPETNWHLYWKKRVPKDCREVTIEKDGEKHRADIVTRNGTVIELQHSSISVDEIEKREKFYGKIIWLFDVRECCPKPKYSDNGVEPIIENKKEIRLRIRAKDDIHTFRWCHPRKSIAYAKANVYLDVGRNEIFGLKKMYLGKRCGGWGLLKPKSFFVDWLKKQCHK